MSSPAAVADAAARIRPFVRRTPTLTCGTFDRLAGRPLHFKCENFQTTGSFKYRGATNAVQKLAAEIAARGVVTHSSGNHAQALAKAAAVRGIPAHVVMPRTSSPVKKAAVIGYGGEVIECEPTLEAREATAADLVARTGGTLIPPFDHADVIAGQGTLFLELLADAPDLTAVVVPVGGGGMISGVCYATELATPRVRVIGAEPAAVDDAARSKKAGEKLPQTAGPASIADGLLTSLGTLTWPVVRDNVTTIYTVTEDEIRAAMRLVWERLKVVIEPSAAVGVAVVLGERFRATEPAGPVGVVLCGGNVSLDKLYW